MLIAAQTNGFRRKEQRRIVLDMVASYRTTMATFASMGNLDVWYSRFEIEDVLARYEAQFKTRIVKRAKKALAKARTRDSMSAASKLCEVVDGEMRIVDQSPLIIPIDRLGRGARDQTFGRLRGMVDTYRETLPADRRSLLDQFDLVDFAHKVVGVGSVGNEAWIALLLGSVGQDVLFLQVKEAQPSVLEDHAGASEFENHGERVVIGQRRMQASSDIFLGWLRVDEEQRGGQRDYYCRQLRDWKASAEIEQMYPDGMAIYGQMCGWTLARAHARTGDRVAIAAYLGGSDSFDQAILAFSEAYAEQNELDYAALQSAEKSGRVVAKAGL
jgi:uncharacterized protein (DUF2252 family)